MRDAAALARGIRDPGMRVARRMLGNELTKADAVLYNGNGYEVVRRFIRGITAATRDAAVPGQPVLGSLSHSVSDGAVLYVLQRC